MAALRDGRQCDRCNSDIDLHSGLCEECGHSNAWTWPVYCVVAAVVFAIWAPIIIAGVCGHFNR